MQLGEPSVPEISSPNTAVTAEPPEETAHEGVNGGEMVGIDVDANSSEDKGIEGGGDESNKINFGGNRWPRQETLALLKIRLDMDAVFRDSSLKAPLWEEVSRKLAELGYHRSAKKCKEKFENVYKYNKRTKENKSGKSHGKTYKFFDQLQALENQFTVSYTPKSQAILTTTLSNVTTTFPFTNPTLISPSPPTNATTTTTTSMTNPPNPSPPQNHSNHNVPHSFPNMNNLFSTTTSTSSSTASDEDLEERYKRKRKWKDYFKRLTRKVLLKQEEMQNKFLEAMDKRERDRLAQQDNWRMQEIARINRDHEILIQERSTAAAKDAAVIALLQNLSGQQNPMQLLPPSFALPSVSQIEPSQQKEIIPQTQSPILTPNNNFEIKGANNGHSTTSTITTASLVSSSSSRWPKAEVHALIRLRTTLEIKYQENGPKAPLWEDISIGMQRLGYNRSAKRCKEKWENINKYFKKVKESNKERPEDSKTCPYFHELDALYKEKSKSQNPFGISFQNVIPNEMMMMEPLMVQPEQQWRPPPESLEEGIGKENANECQEKEEEDGDDDAEEYGDSVEDEGASLSEIATNN
ncbi:trihelix transcription factor GT-2-like [Abrus precatorius]|uniref:Trihelix transcription factor GT-2-like n=1 Tax=Abrus precatorius TaxID=3816 RepID=A0A8B8LRD2_ABRPR|nr:trihelix transcription factor GT-2-like [Abrus precatorius]